MSALAPPLGNKQTSIWPASTILTRSAPSTLKVWFDKMVVLTTLGGGYGAAIEYGRQERRGDTAQGKLNKRPPIRHDQGQRYANDHQIETHHDLGAEQRIEGSSRAAGGSV